MAAGRSVRTVKRQSSRYIYGNTVRKAEAWPQPSRQPEAPVRKKQVSRQVRKNRRQALHMNRAYVVFLALSAVLALAACIWYLQIRAELTSRSENIGQMQQELAQLNEENTSRYNSIIDSVNLEDVKNRAINELGMVPAGTDQIVTYQNPVGDYIKQYAQIPESGMLAQSETTENSR